MKKHVFLFLLCVVFLFVGCGYVQSYNAHRFDREVEIANRLLRYKEVPLKDLMDLDSKMPYEAFREKLTESGMSQKQILFLCCTPNRYVRLH